MLRLTLLAALALYATAATADDCAFRAERRVDADTSGLSALKLATGAGDLRIEGVAGLAKIEIRGKACASTQAQLDEIKLDSQRDGGTQRIGTVLPETDGGGGWLHGNYAYMDVEVRVPATLALDVRDSSGDVNVQHVLSLALDDSSGDIDVRDVTGDVRINDSSGDIRVDDVKGNVLVPHDSSGDIRIERVRGNAEVSEDSSGDILIDHIDGNARVGSDSSGSIEFRSIGRDASVGDDSSGEIAADGVGGSFTVSRKSGGARNIRHSNVTGKVSLPSND